MFHRFHFALAVIACICVATVGLTQENTGGDHVVILTDTDSNTRTDSLRITAKDFADVLPKNQPAWSVEKTTLHGGKQEGCELVTIDNGVLEIVVIPTRGMSVLRVTKKANANAPGTAAARFGWDSPVKEVVHPQYINLESRGGLGWLEGFNEWMVRCGLEYAGHPGKDVFTNNVGDKVEMDLTLHGKIGNIPASKVTVTVDREAPHRIRLQGIVNERMFYGPKLELITEISTVPGESSLRITDTLVNHGADEQEFQLIYHTNFGTPLLEKDARTVVAAEKIEPMNENAAKSIDNFASYLPPTKGFLEQVYLVHPLADARGRTQAMLINAAGDQAASVAWNTSQLPYLTIWKNTAAEADGYVTGIEPGTGFPFNRNVERHFGRVPKLASGQSRSFELEYGFHTGSEAVNKLEAEIKNLQTTPVELAHQPPILPTP
ncbi:aldose 1-epimerase family protein [Novipirellula sp. SH528]|uniref:aldose 1-epimerase family protein n=1 Tax=Novipirellula sp. SH528 TaxID=3454466 RepID=UPI003FA18E0D